MVMDEIMALTVKLKGVITEVANPKQRELGLAAKLRQNSEHMKAAKRREGAVKKKLAAIKKKACSKSHEMR